MIERDLQTGIAAHRQADEMRGIDLEVIEHRHRVAHDVVVAVDIRVCRHIGRRVAARRIGDAAVALAELAHLRLPAAVVGGEFVHEQNGRALPDLLVIKPHFIGGDRVWHEMRSGYCFIRSCRAQKQNSRQCRRPPHRTFSAIVQLGWRAAQPASMRRRQAVWRSPSKRRAAILASARLAAAQVRYSRSLTRGTSGCFAEQFGEGADAAIHLQLGQRLRHVAGRPEGDDTAGRRMAHLVDARPDRRLDIVAAFHIGETLPAAPSLHHQQTLHYTAKLCKHPRTRHSDLSVPPGQPALLIRFQGRMRNMHASLMRSCLMPRQHQHLRLGRQGGLGHHDRGNFGDLRPPIPGARAQGNGRA